jgi:NitT/TauT family transport system ATP-binding protein
MVNFLSLKKLNFSYNNSGRLTKKIINKLSLEIFQGEIVSLVGFSGCGKTTLIRLIAGILLPKSGTISLLGQTIVQARDKGLLNYVPQQNALLPHLTVRENILLPLKVRERKVDNNELRELLQVMSLEKIQDLYPKQLSGGLSQRVATARALVTNPALLLMDEPFASLDEFSREKINEDLLKWQSKHHTTIVFVTHNIQEAVFLSQRVFVMSNPYAKIATEIKVSARRRDKAFRSSILFNNYANQIRKYISK